MGANKKTEWFTWTPYSNFNISKFWATYTVNKKSSNLIYKCNLWEINKVWLSDCGWYLLDRSDLNTGQETKRFSWRSHSQTTGQADRGTLSGSGVKERRQRKKRGQDRTGRKKMEWKGKERTRKEAEERRREEPGKEGHKRKEKSLSCIMLFIPYCLLYCCIQCLSGLNRCKSLVNRNKLSLGHWNTVLACEALRKSSQVLASLLRRRPLGGVTRPKSVSQILAANPI